MNEIKLQTAYTENITVTKEMLACNVGSGSVEVYATPMMITLMEHCAVACLNEFMEDGETSVGTLMNTTHDAATPLGMEVYVCATVVATDRKKVTFEIIAKDCKDTIGKAIHERFIVVKDKFEQKAKQKLD